MLIKLVYKNMILEYGNIFRSTLSSATHNKLQIVQNRGHNVALRKDKSESSVKLHLDADLLKLKYRSWTVKSNCC